MDGPARAQAPELVACDGAPLGSADPTRRWALRFADGGERFAGVTRVEGWAAAGDLAPLATEERERALVQVSLPVVLSDGAGPHLVDADGRLVLALGPHPGISGASVAMGEAVPTHVVGLVERVGDGPAWRWLARARVAPGDRVTALDEADAVPGRAEAGAWERRWGGVG